VAAGVSETAAAEIFDFASSHYPRYLTAYPDDRWQKTLHSHPDDLDFYVAEWCEDKGWAGISPEDVASVPNDPSLLELGRWLDAVQPWAPRT
jgi:hypothetical protein